MARTDVNTATNKWLTRVQASGQYYQAGVQNPAVDWAGPAVAASGRRNAGLQRAIQDGRIDAGINRVGTAKWRTNTVAKGVTNWTTNTPKASGAYNQGMQRVYGWFPQADQAIANMPANTPQERIQRAAVFLQSMSDQAQTYKAQNG